MKKIINYTGMAIIMAVMCSCQPKPKVESGDLPAMPMKAIYENSLAYTWEQKPVLASKVLSDMETMANWEHRGGYGTLSLSDLKPYKGKYALLLESPTKGLATPRNGRPWGASSAYYKVNNEDWTDFNRISFWIYPDMPGHHVIPISMLFYNDGEEKAPSSFHPNGVNYPVVENQKWNKVYLEIAHLGRDKVTGITIGYDLKGNEIGATGTARFFIDELYLEKVVADHVEGWDVAPGEIAYNHAGYVKDFSKVAFTSEKAGEKFYLKDNMSGNTVKEGVVTTQTMPVGVFQLMDFSDVNTDGTYVLEVGKLKTKPFAIGSFLQVYRSSIIKTINHFYCQRCGFAIPGIHDVCHLDWMSVHEGLTLPVHGGWHDAGDLSQGLVNTSEAAYSMMALAMKLEKSDPVVSARLLEEAEWGVSWVLRTRFEDGYRNVWSTKDMWTDGIIGNEDDFNENAAKQPHANFIAAVTEAVANRAFKEKNPYISALALKCAIEDYGYGIETDSRRMGAELTGTALNAAIALYEATLDDFYKKKAIEHANYLVSCQQQDDANSEIPLKGFFYRNPEKDAIQHYSHRAHEQDFVVGLVKLSELFPSEAAEWKKALRLYADYYKTICAYTAPYYMIPAGIYDLTKTRNDVEAEQIRNGVKLNERYYVRRFPVWTTFRGNSGTTLTQAKALAVVANFLKDKELLDIVYHTFDWHLGVNPFAQSLMYGEGYRFTALFSRASGNMVGGLPVGVQSHFNRDIPYWPTEVGYTWKEVWVHPSTRWLMLASDFM